MARNKKTTTTVEEIETQPAAENSPELAPGQLSIAERLAQIIDPENDELFCRIYRQTGPAQKPIREFIERVDGILVDDEYIAEKYGGGSYLVRYVYRENEVLKNTSGVFNISEEYRPKKSTGVVVERPEQKNPLASFLEGLNAEKVGGLIAAIEGVRKIFAPPPPPVDFTRLMEVMIANKQQSVGDAVLIEALKGAQRTPQQPLNLLEQVRQLQEVKQLIKDEPQQIAEEDEDDDEKGGPMNVLIKTALGMLPAFLAQNNNNFEATGAQFKDNAYIKNLLAKSPDLASDFVEAARQEYGDQKAQELARGFGLNVQYIEQEPQQLEQNKQEKGED